MTRCNKVLTISCFGGDRGQFGGVRESDDQLLRVQTCCHPKSVWVAMEKKTPYGPYGHANNISCPYPSMTDSGGCLGSLEVARDTYAPAAAKEFILHHF